MLQRAYTDHVCVEHVLGAHHLDLRAATANDPDWLVDQRASEVKLIEGWIADYYKKTKTVFNM